jgi:hypothetical protein
MAVDLSWNFRETGTNIANNTSTVQLDIYITTSGSSWNGDEQWGQVWWNGEHWTGGYTLPRDTTTLVHSETQTITHNPDGTGSTSFSCSIPTTPSGGDKYGEQTIGLTTLPRAASIDSFVCSSKYLDGTMTVKYTPKATFNYKLRLSIPNVVAIVTKNLGSQGTGQKTTTATFTSSELNTIYARIGANGNSCTIGAVIETWSGSTKVGESSEYTLTLYMPESIKPSIGTISLTEAVSGLNAKFGAFVQNKSKATVNFTASGYNAGGITSTIKSYNVSINNQSFTTNTFTTNLLTTSGTNTITVKVTDSRGRTATKSQTFNVLGYTKPTISLFSAIRNNTTNTTIDTIFSATISSLNNKNDKTFKIKLDNTDKQTYTDTYSKTNQAYAITGTSSTTSYNVTLSITDYFETVTRTIRVGTAFALMHFTEDGNKIAIGHYYDTSAGGVFQIGGKTVLGNSSTHSISEDGGTYSGSATKWAGTTYDMSTANDTETWIPVLNNGKFQHTSKQKWTSKTHSNYNNNQNQLATISCLTYWNGAYNSSNASNLTYAHQGTIQCKPKNLYNNTTGTNGTVQLSETAANFSFLRIYYRNDNNRYGSITVYSPNGKTVNIFAPSLDNGSKLNMKVKDMYVNGKNMTVTYTYMLQAIDGSMVFNNNNNTTYIVRVDGYR